MMKRSNPAAVIALALAMVIALSFIPWSTLTGGTLKDYSFFSDITGSPDIIESSEPEALSVVSENPEPIESSDKPGLSNVSGDSEASAESVHFDASVISDTSIIDFSEGKQGFKHFRAALANRGRRAARVAFLGDSYIEGDILCQNLREALQDEYGGSGIGYTPIHSEIPGFRRSVTQSSKGWVINDITKTTKNMPLHAVYCMANSGATATFKGVSYFRHLDSWDKTSLLLVSPVETTVSVTVDGQETQTFNIAAADGVQEVTVHGKTTKATFSIASDSLTTIVGAYLDSETGVLVDNMPIRGYSGIRHHTISRTLAAQSREFVDYDLIIIEYGMNSISASQLEYTSYTTNLKKDIQHIRELYPNADILLMGIGDRGEKKGTEIHTMAAVAPMIQAQRKLAADLGLLYFNTYSAMGGKDSAVRWAETKDVNKDYIHLSYKGGKRLGDILSREIIEKVGELSGGMPSPSSEEMQNEVD